MDAENAPIVTVFGTDHSPWVQAVLLALSDRGIAYRLRPFPPSVGAYLRGGLVMPSCQWPDGTITQDSFEIIAESARRYGGAAPSLEAEADQTRLERLFLTYVLARAPPGRRLSFVHAWACKRDAPSRADWTILRALLSLYFLVLIIVGGRQLRKAGRPLFDAARLRRACQSWEARLGAAPFLGGAAPDASDFGLCGHVQCMASGLTDETLPILEEHPGLLSWLERMHHRQPATARLHSRRVFDRGSGVAPASGTQLLFFYVGLAFWLSVFPLTLSVLGYAFYRRGSNQSRSGARLRAR